MGDSVAVKAKLVREVGIDRRGQVVKRGAREAGLEGAVAGNVPEVHISNVGPADNGVQVAIEGNGALRVASGGVEVQDRCAANVEAVDAAAVLPNEQAAVDGGELKDAQERVASWVERRNAIPSGWVEGAELVYRKYESGVDKIGGESLVAFWVCDVDVGEGERVARAGLAGVGGRCTGVRQVAEVSADVNCVVCDCRREDRVKDTRNPIGSSGSCSLELIPDDRVATSAGVGTLVC